MTTENSDTPVSGGGTPGAEQFLPDESWQPNKEDALLDVETEDILDEGMTAPDTDPLASLDLSESGQAEGETWDDRLAREEPEVWEKQPDDDEDRAAPGLGGEEAPDVREGSGVGRLVARPDDDDASDEVGEQQDLLAQDAGVAGGGFVQEEAAMHIEGEGAVDEGGTIEPDERG